MRGMLGAVLLAAIALSATARAQDGGGSEHWDARITATTGDVVVHPADGGDDVPGTSAMPLEEGDRVTTSADSTAEIALDGSSLISLAANSDFTLKNTQKSASIFSLTLGSLMAKIQKLGSQSMSVQSPTAVAAVRGTEFGVDVDGERSHVGVFDEGRVEVQGGSGERQVLTPNQETSVQRGQAPTRAEPLRRFAGRREAMRAHIRRLADIRRNWRAIPAGERRARRARAFQRARQRRAENQRRRASEGGAAARRDGRGEKGGTPPAKKRRKPEPKKDRERETERDRGERR